MATEKTKKVTENSTDEYEEDEVHEVFSNGDFSDKYKVKLPVCNPLQTNYEKYYESKELGRGTFSTVYEGKALATAEKVAVKIVQKQSIKPQTMRLLRREMGILRKLKNDNIVHMKDACVLLLREP